MLQIALTNRRANGPMAMTSSQHVYEVRPRKDHRGVNLISDALPFGRLWYGEPNAVANAIGYAIHGSRSHDGEVQCRRAELSIGGCAVGLCDDAG
jgi:hypothetical protein